MSQPTDDRTSGAPWQTRLKRFTDAFNSTLAQSPNPNENQSSPVQSKLPTSSEQRTEGGARTSNRYRVKARPIMPLVASSARESEKTPKELDENISASTRSIGFSQFTFPHIFDKSHTASTAVATAAVMAAPGLERKTSSSMEAKMPSNFYSPEAFVDLLYRIAEMESESKNKESEFGLAILDIDNLRGHVQSPLTKAEPKKNAKSKTNNRSGTKKFYSYNYDKDVRIESTSPATSTEEQITEEKEKKDGSSGGSTARSRKSIENIEENNATNKESEKIEQKQEYEIDPNSGMEMYQETFDTHDIIEEIPTSLNTETKIPNTGEQIQENDRKEEIEMETENQPSPTPNLAQVDETMDDDPNEENIPPKRKSKKSSKKVQEMLGMEEQEVLQTQTQNELDDQYQELQPNHENLPIDEKKDSPISSNKNDVPTDDKNDSHTDEKNDSHIEKNDIHQGHNTGKEQSEDVDERELHEALLYGDYTVIKHTINGNKDNMNNIVNEKYQGFMAVDEHRNSNMLSVGMNPLDPYVLFWNNSKSGESVVKVVQDIILMSISKNVNVTHFGFGEFAILSPLENEQALGRLTKRILTRVSSNVGTEKLGPVTLCAGIAMYQPPLSVSQWINRCRQACRLAKINGRGRIANYTPRDRRRSLANQLMHEIKKPESDFSGTRLLDLIRRGADLNYQYVRRGAKREEEGDTPLMLAIKKKNKQAIRYLIQFDFDSNLRNRKGKTVLILALEHGCDRIMLDLLVNKRDLNPRLRDDDGETALSIALKLGYREISKTLILLGADPLLTEKNIVDEWFEAVRKADTEKLQDMMTMNFPIDMIDEDDMTALMLACESGRLHLVKWLLSNGSNVNVQGKKGYTALMISCFSGYRDIWEYLLGKGANLHCKGDDGLTLMHCAAVKDNMTDVIKLIFHTTSNNERAGVINAQNMYGMTPLMISAENKTYNVATQLLRHQSELDIVNKNGDTALICACRSNSGRIASMLVTLGANMDVQNNDHKTGLMIAAERGYSHIVATLVKYGADVNLCDLNGHNAEFYASSNGFKSIAEMIRTGRLSEMEDLMEQITILQQKNESLESTISQLTEMNQTLTSDINNTELQKNQLQQKLNRAVGQLSNVKTTVLSRFGRNNAT